MTKAITDALQQLEQDYIKRTPNSKVAIARAAEVMPGGETRSVLHFSPYPLVIKSGEGSTLTDIDGHCYRDFVSDFGAGLYGHSQPAIQAVIKEVVDKGLTLGGLNQYEGELARLLVERFPALEKVRFTNSGTEANLMALTTARVVTGRDKILVMLGAYHGSVLTFSSPASRTFAPYDVVFGSFNDLAKTEQAVADCGKDLAAIIVEPVMGAGGIIPADQSFLQGLSALADRSGALLIFDEVITSRMGPGGAQEIYGITPDLMTCGKYLGGGGNFGAFGGRADLMSIYDANRSDAVMHGGTFNNNVITMAAGATGLRQIFTPQVAAKLLETGNHFRSDLNAICRQHEIAMQVSGLGPVLGFHFHHQPIRSPEQAVLSNPKAIALFHMAMLERGFYIIRRGGAMLSIVHTDEDFDAFKSAFTDVLIKYGGLFNETAEIQ
jgi:glutamate-1-semialdehyde 2,1-aminomutase